MEQQRRSETESTREQALNEAAKITRLFPLVRAPAAELPQFSTEVAELRHKLGTIRDVVQDLIDLLDELEGDADEEVEEDVGVDDLGENDEAA